MTTVASATEAPPKKKLLFAVSTVLLAIFLTPIVWNIHDHLSQGPVTIPDEQIAGLKLLAEKFSGPRYFQPDPAQENAGIVSDRYYITVAAAKAQAPGVALERKLDAAQTAKLYAIIERIAEPPSSRVLGERSVSTLRLNLALDELH